VVRAASFASALPFLLLLPFVAPEAFAIPGDCDCKATPKEGDTVTGTWEEEEGESVGGAILEFHVTDKIGGKCVNTELCTALGRLCSWDFTIKINSWDPQSVDIAGASYKGDQTPVSGVPPQIFIDGCWDEATCAGNVKPQVNLGRHGGTGESTFVKVASGTTVFNCAQCEANEITS
jgi:hypothetical protein